MDATFSHLVRLDNARLTGLAFLLLQAGLIWLNSGLPTLPLPWLNFGLAFAAVFILPGWLLADLLLPPPWPNWPVKLPLAFTFSLGLLAPAAVVVLTIGATLPQFGWLVAALNLLLFGIWLRRESVAAAEDGAFAPRKSPDNNAKLNPYLLGLVVLVALGVLLLHGQTAGASDVSDAPSYLLYLRHHMEQPLTPAVSPLPLEAAPSARAINGWWVVLALLARLSHAELLTFYFWLLPPLLMLLSLLALYSLAVILFKDRNAALLAMLLQLLYAAASINSHDWLGRGFFDRIIEDKFLIWLLLLPVSQLLVLRYLKNGGLKALAALALSVASLALTHPIGVAQFGLSTVAFALVYVGFNLSRDILHRAALLVTPLLLVILVPWLQRSLIQQGGTAFVYEGGSAGQFELSQTRLWLFSALDNLFMLHPHQVTHPLAILAIILTPLLVLYLRRSVTAQFLLANTTVTLLLLFNPLTAPLLGRVITPWMLWRISWLLPVAFTLAFFLDKLTTVINRRLDLNPASLWTAVLPLVGLLLLTVALVPYLADSRQILTERSALTLTPEKQGLLTNLSGWTGPEDIVLASNDLSTMIPLFSSTTKVLTFRWKGLTQPELARIYQTRLVSPATLELLQHWQVDYIIVEQNQPMAFQLTGLPKLFTPRYQNKQYALYQVQANPDTNKAAVQGNQAFLQGKLARAEAFYQQALAADSRNTAALYGLALTHQAQNRLTAAEETLTQLLTAQPDHLPARLALAQIYRQDGKIETAQSQLETAVKSRPDSQISAEALGDFYLALEQMPQAAAAYARAVPQPPAVMPGEYHLALAKLYQRKGMPDMARDAYQTTVDQETLPTIGLQPGFMTGIRHSNNPGLLRLSQAYTGLAGLRQQAGDPVTAEAAYQQAVSLLYNNQSAAAGLAKLYLTTDRPNETINLYRQAAQRNPNSAWPHLELGRVYLNHVNNNPP